MKYNIDSYRFYYTENHFSFSLQVKVTMKEAVEPEILSSAVNRAMKRYPYFAVKVSVDDEGGYIISPNSAPISVLPMQKRIRKLGSREIGYHLAFVEYEGRDIYFNISHSLCGGRGAFPWVMTCVLQYVRERYNVEPVCPGIRKSEEPLFDDEVCQPSLDMLSKEKPNYVFRSRNPFTMLKDYLLALSFPFIRRPNYYLFSFPQQTIATYAKENGHSISSLFIAIMGKTMDRVLPDKVEIIGGEIAHNPAADIGIPNCHSDFISRAYVDYSRDEIRRDMSELGPMTRDEIRKQIHPSVSCSYLRRTFEKLERLDEIKGLANKRRFFRKNNPYTNKDVKHGTYIVNYTGWMHWGEVADYIESYGCIVEGHLLLEITSMEGKIFVSFMQLLDKKKYVEAFKKVLSELGLPYSVEGPYRKHISKHDLPTR